MIPVPPCPICGRQLTVSQYAIVDSQTAPWLCDPCRHGFWPSELTDDARAFYDPIGHHFGALHPTIDARRCAEAAAALQAGTSVTEAMTAHLSEEHKAMWAERLRQRQAVNN